MKLSEALEKARDIIAEHWSKGDFSDGKGNYCALGACRMVITGSVWEPQLGESRKLYKQMKTALATAIYGEPSRSGVVMFNDRRSTTHGDIMRVFNTAVRNAQIEETSNGRVVGG